MSSRYELSKAVQQRLKDSNLTAEEVVRKALGMSKEFTTSDGTTFPEGTVFMEFYKDRAVSAVVKNGELTIENKTFESLSAAAAHYTGRITTNGWGFWKVRLPGKQDFVPASTFGPQYSLKASKEVKPGKATKSHKAAA